MKLKKHLLPFASAAILSLTLYSAQSDAAGFYIQEQSVSGLGASFAGEAAMARDASTIYFNPAGMTYLDGPQLQLGAHVIAPSSKVRSTGSTAATGLAPAPTAVVAIDSGKRDGDDSIAPTPVPNLFAAYPLTTGATDKPIWLGLGITAPFGLGNDYGKGFFGRYDSTRSDLKVIDIAPTVAYQINDWLSLGGGLNVQYVDVVLQNAIYNPGLGAATPPGPDGFQSLEGDNWNAGFNIGAMIQPRDDTRIGLTYRSEVSHNIEGESRRNGVGAALQAQGIANGTFDGTANLDLPDIAQVAVMHELNNKWRVMGGVTWFGWSDFEKIRTDFDGNAQPVSDVPQAYKDTFAYNIGLEYDWKDWLTLRGGYQFDATPTEDGYRTTRTPDGDRNWFSGGATVGLNDKLDLDLALTYITVESEDIALSRVNNLVTINGKTDDSDIIIGALSLTYKF